MFSHAYVLAVRCEAVEYASRKDDQIVLLQSNPNPFILRISDIKESIAIKDVSDLLVLVQVFIEEHLDFFFVYSAHLVGRYSDFISVLVRARRGNLVDRGDGGAVMVEDAELRQVVLAH